MTTEPEWTGQTDRLLQHTDGNKIIERRSVAATEVVPVQAKLAAPEPKPEPKPDWNLKTKPKGGFTG